MILQCKTIITFMVLLIGCRTAAGQVDSLKQPGKPSGARHPSTIFTGGTLDILQGGQMNASARLFRLYLGRPGQKGVPLSISTGVMAGALAGYPLQDEGVSSLVNPAAGLLNMRVDGDHRIRKREDLRVHAQGAVRVLNLFDPALFVNYRFVNALVGAGLVYSTGAWEEGREKDAGICWCSVRVFASANPATLFSDYLRTNFFPLLTGCMAGMGVDLSERLQVRASYFRFCNAQEAAVFRQPVIQLSFNYQGS